MSASAPCRSEPHAAPPARLLRAGVIGLGVGTAHLEAYSAHPRGRVVAVCDLDSAKREAARRGDAAVRSFEHADELLADPEIDVVSIASYDDKHAEQTLAALRAGKHVFVEKPLCLNRDDARRIRTALRERPGLRLSSNLVLRVCPRFAALKQRIDAGELGDLFSIEGDYLYGRLHKITHGWRGQIDGYSVVLGGAIHIVDLMLWLTDDAVTEVFALGNQIASRGSQFRYRDQTLVLLRFESGLIGKVGVSYGCVRPHFHALSVYGTRGTWVNDTPHARWYDSRDPKREPRLVDDPYPGVHKGALLAGFIDAILSGGECAVTEDDVFRCLSVCLAIEDSAATGQPVRVAYI